MMHYKGILVFVYEGFILDLLFDIDDIILILLIKLIKTYNEFEIYYLGPNKFYGTNQCKNPNKQILDPNTFD